jgi:hypothetical protein
MRTTRKELESLFALLCNATGHTVAVSYADKGGWALEHDSTGYIIHEYLPEGGAHEPFGSRRRSASEMADAMRFAIRAVQAVR